MPKKTVLILQANFNDVKKDIDVSITLHDLNLSLFDATPTAGAWLVGNSVLGARGRTDTATEICLLVARREDDHEEGNIIWPDRQACDVWKQLGRDWTELGWSENFEFVKQPERVNSFETRMLISDFGDDPSGVKFASYRYPAAITPARNGDAYAKELLEGAWGRAKKAIDEGKAAIEREEAWTDRTPDEVAKEYLDKARVAAAPGAVDEQREQKEATAESKLQNPKTMKDYYADYNVQTAMQILEAIPKAYKSYRSSRRGRWGPGLIRKETMTIQRSETVGKYLKAFCLAEVKVWKGVPIPYHPSHRDPIQSAKKK
jgi:hypothetical protein